MSLLSPRLQLRVAQKQILTPGLVQMVTVLQLNRLELKEMINQEIVNNPVLEESADDAGEEITAEELQPLLEGGTRLPTRPINRSSKRPRWTPTRWIGSAETWRSTATLFPDAEEARGRGRSGHAGANDPLLETRQLPIPSTKSISGPFLTIIWIPAIRAPRRNRSRNHPLKPSFPPRYAGRSPALAVERQLCSRRSARRRRVHHRQSG